MKVCPTCQRNYPDLISTCPADRSELVDGSSPAAGNKITHAAAAPAAAKEKDADTRTLQEKLFAPLPKLHEAAPAPAPVKAAAPPPPPVPPKPATPAPPTGKMPVTETVFDDTPQKTSRIPALPSAQDIPWKNIATATGLIIFIAFMSLFLFHKSSAPPPPSTELTGGPSSVDVDMEFTLRETLARNAALHNQNIEVRVNNGTVLLTGEASSVAKIDQAVKAAQAMTGVRDVVNHIQVDPEVGNRSVSHSVSTSAGLSSPNLTTEQGLATQAKARDLTTAGDHAMSRGDYKAAASFYKQALALNPEDTAASLGYTQAVEKLQ